MTGSFPQLKPLSATAPTRYLAVPKLSIEKISVIQASFPLDTDKVSFYMTVILLDVKSLSDPVHALNNFRADIGNLTQYPTSMQIFHRVFALANFIFKLKNVRRLPKGDHQELLVLAQAGEHYLRSTQFGVAL